MVCCKKTATSGNFARNDAINARNRHPARGNSGHLTRMPAPVNRQHDQSSLREVPSDCLTIAFPQFPGPQPANFQHALPQSFLGMEHKRKLTVPRDPVRAQAPADLGARRLQILVHGHAPKAATPRYTAGSPIASPSAPAVLVTDAAMAILLGPYQTTYFNSCRFGQMAVRIEPEVPQIPFDARQILRA